jgi:hypothetical protein
MKNIISALWLCLVVICGLPGCSKTPGNGPASKTPTNSIPAADTTNNLVEIKIKWSAGKKYYLQLETIQSWENTLSKQQEPVKTTMGITHDYTVSVVKELAGGGRELELEFTAQKMFYQMGEIPVLNFDSAQSKDQDAANPVAPILRKLLGARIRCFTDANGKVTKLEGFSELRARMTGNQPETRATLEAMFNETNLKQMCDFVAALQPEEPVKIGDTWPVHLEMPDPVGLMVVNLNCTLKGWEPQDNRQCVRIEYQGEVSSQPAATSQTSPARIDDGTVSGKAWFDPNLGMLANSATEQHMTYETTGKGQTTTTKFNMTINFRLIRVTNG